jgi:hypothetical protein
LQRVRCRPCSHFTIFHVRAGGPDRATRAYARCVGRVVPLCWPSGACATQPRSATAVQHKADGQQARDEQQQQRSGRPEGRAQHGRASEPAPTAAATGGASEHDSGALPARESMYLSLSYLLSIYLILSISVDRARPNYFLTLFPTRREIVFAAASHAEGGRGRLRAQGQPGGPARAQEGGERTLQARQLRERRQVLHDRHRPVEYAASTGSFPFSFPTCTTCTTATTSAPASAVASASTSASASASTATTAAAA